MSQAREAFFQRVRRALREGNRAGAAALEPRGSAGYQGAGPDVAEHFRERLSAAGGHAYLVADREAAVARVLEVVRTAAARRILLGRGPFLDTLDLAGRLRDPEYTLVRVDSLSPDAGRDAFFAADLAISGVDYLLAETGTLVLCARPDEPRSLSLLPPVHVAVAERSQLVPDLFDLFESELWKAGASLPSCLSLITGPSKTGDIELRLVTGVHGPGEVHVILVGS